MIIEYAKNRKNIRRNIRNKHVTKKLRKCNNFVIIYLIMEKYVPYKG